MALSQSMRWPLWKALAVLAFTIIVWATYTSYPLAASSASKLLLPITSGSQRNQPSDGMITSPSGARYAAVIIEQTFNDQLIPVILHFANVLPSWWAVILYTLEEDWEMPSSALFRRAVADNRVSIKFLPPGTVLMHHRQTSRFLSGPWLWEQLQWADRMLLFQADSILCSRAETTVDDFVAYDYVGAPISANFGHGYNGGLSIRNPELFLRITKEADFEKSGETFEDQWFYKEAKARVEQGVKLPDVDVAKTFSVETIYYEKPLGYHQASRFQPEKMGEIEAWCPEVKMVVGRRVGG